MRKKGLQRSQRIIVHYISINKNNCLLEILPTQKKNVLNEQF